MSDNSEAIEWLLEHEQSKLTTWEFDFLDNVQDKPRLTENEQKKLNEIWREVMEDGNRG